MYIYSTSTMHILCVYVSLFVMQAGCAISNGIWLLHWFICSQCKKARNVNSNELSEPYLGMKDVDP